MKGHLYMEDKLLTIDDIQKRLGIGRNLAYKLVSEIKIKAFRIGRSWKISEEALEEYVRNNENDLS